LIIIKACIQVIDISKLFEWVATATPRRLSLIIFIVKRM